MENTILSIPINKLEFSSSSDSNKAKAKLYVMHEDLNYNESVIPFDAIQDAEGTISNIPILAYVKKEADGEPQDFGGHELKQELDTVNGQLTLKTTFLEQPIGVIPETNGYHYETIDGQRWVVVNGYVWKSYSNEAYDILEKAKTKGISMEIEVVDGQVDAKTGFYIIKKFKYLGITVLGDDITPAMGDKAKIQMYSLNNKQEYFSLCKELNEELKYGIEKEVKSLTKEKSVKDTGRGDANGLDVKEEIKQIQEAEMMSEDCDNIMEDNCNDDVEDDCDEEMMACKDEESNKDKHACKDEEEKVEKHSCKDEESDKEKESCRDEESDKEKHACKDEESDKEKHSIKEEKVKTDNEDADNRKSNKKTAEAVEKVEEDCEDKKMAKCDDEKEHYARKKKEEEIDNSANLSINYIAEQITIQLDKIKENVEAWWSDNGMVEMPKYMMVDLLVEQKVVIVTTLDNEFYGIPYLVKGDEIILELDKIKPYISTWKAKETFGGTELKFEAKKRTTVEALIKDSEKAYKDLDDKLKESKEEVEKLKEFKLEVDKKTRFVEIDNLISEFNFSENEVSDLREKAYSEEISMEGLTKELYALAGMKLHKAKEVYSSSKQVLGYSINSTQAKGSKYGEASIYFNK